MRVKQIYTCLIRIFGPVFCTVVYFALWLGVFAISQKFLHSIGIQEDQEMLSLESLGAALVGNLILIGSLTLLAVVWMGLQGKAFSSVGLDKQVRTIWTGLGLAGVGILAAFALAHLNGWLLIVGMRSIFPAFIGVLLLLLSALGAGINEEIVFRGIFYSISDQFWPRWVTALISSLAFALLHVYEDPAHHLGRLIVGFAGGLLFAWARSIHDSLWLPIGLHVSFDFTEWLLNLMGDEPRSPFLVSINGPHWAVGEAGLTSWLPLLVAASGLLLYSWLRKSNAGDGMEAGDDSRTD